MEDSLRAEMDKMKADLTKEWEKKLKEAVEKTKSEESEKARKEREKLS